MSDREMLELAAKAAGIAIERNRRGLVLLQILSPEKRIGCIWNPLTDDGDALRLAVKLRMSVFHSLREVYVVDDDGDIEVAEAYKSDIFAATRRAIVRVAAEIGRQMP